MPTDDKSQFMLETYKDSSQNVMHIEGQLFNHMSFFLTLFIGVLTAGIAIIQLTKDPDSSMSMSETVGVLSLPFLFLVLVGQFEVQMIMQLRVRKIKFIESLVKAREYFINSEPELSGFIILPSKMEKAPPYLRVKSEDWYKLLFIISLNTVSLFFFWVGLPFLVNFLLSRIFPSSVSYPALTILLSCLYIIWIAAGLFLCFFVYWFASYRRVMNYCTSYDRKRETEMGKISEYDLLELPVPSSWFNRSMGDWFIILEKMRSRDESAK